LGDGGENRNDLWNTQKLGNIASCCTTVSVARRTLSHETDLLKNNSCVSDYLPTTLDNDLRMRVGAAVLAENYAKNPNVW
jgi:hypothetical protein